MSDKSSQDRTGLCTFIFDDGRHCNMPHTASDLRLCYFHEKKELQRLAAKDAALKVSRFLATDLHTACDLSAAFAMLFRSGVQGHTDPKTVNSLTKLGNLLLKTHLLAKDEFLSAYASEWYEIVQQSATFNPNGRAASHPVNPPQPEDQAKPSEPSTAKKCA